MSSTMKNINTALKESVKYIVDRKSGAISSMRTPWSKFNEAGID